MCCSDLRNFKEWLSKTKFLGGSSENKAFTDMFNLQKEMQNMMMSQLKQQHDFLEHRKDKEKTNESTMKLQNLDMLSFSGDKLKWSEVWDSFESAVHRNKKLSKIERFNYLKT